MERVPFVVGWPSVASSAVTVGELFPGAPDFWLSGTGSPQRLTSSFCRLKAAAVTGGSLEPRPLKPYATGCVEPHQN